MHISNAPPCTNRSRNAKKYVQNFISAVLHWGYLKFCNEFLIINVFFFSIVERNLGLEGSRAIVGYTSGTFWSVTVQCHFGVIVGAVEFFPKISFSSVASSALIHFNQSFIDVPCDSPHAFC